MAFAMAEQREEGQQRRREGTQQTRASRRFPDRGGKEWVGRLVDYKELELLRKFMTTSSKLMSRKRAGTNTQEQRALKLAVKHARFLALIPYSGS